MTPEEANRIIAEYMGYDPCISDTCGLYGMCQNCEDLPDPAYSESLDVLVPIWEKLKLRKIYEIDISEKSKPRFSLRIYADLGYTISEEAGTIQEAACIATAKAIENLNAN